MGATNGEPERARRRPTRLPRVAGGAALAAAAVACALWACRVPLVSAYVRRALARAGCPEAAFKITALGTGCLTVEGVRLGGDTPLLSVDSVEARYVLSELVRGRLDRLRVRGVRTGVRVGSGGTVRWPLLECLAAAPDEAGASSSRPRAGVWVGEVSVYDVRVPVQVEGVAEPFELRGECSVLSEPVPHGAAARYRLAARLDDGARARLRLDGAVTPGTGEVALQAEVRLGDVDGLFERARLYLPDQVAALGVTPSRCGLTVRGTVALSAWTNVGPFEVSAELARGSGFELARPEGLVRFQTLRGELSGTPQDMQGRLSAGVAGFRLGGQLQASQEEGRLLGVRGSARLRREGTNQVVRLTVDTDLPGRAAVQVLSEAVPLLPRLLTDGGTLHVEADLVRPDAGGWSGGVLYLAEARRNAVTLPAGRLGAARIVVEGSLAVCGSAPGDLRGEVRVEEGYFSRAGARAGAEARLALAASPPYRRAEGRFEGRIRGWESLAGGVVAGPADGVRLEGRAVLDGIGEMPEWRVSLAAPKFELASAFGGDAPTCRVSVAADGYARYNERSLAWACGVRLSEGKVVTGGAEAGFGESHVAVEMAEVSSERLASAPVKIAAAVSNLWAKAGEGFALSGGVARAAVAWSSGDGLAIEGAPELGWELLQAAGVRLVSEGLTLETADGIVRARAGVRVAGSRFGVEARARVPLDRAGRAELDLSLPETELTAEDALAALLRQTMPGVEVAGRLAAEARLRFQGSRPQVEGQVRVVEGRVRQGAVEVRGVRAVVPFEAGAAVRTSGRPYVAFAAAQAGNLRFDDGRVEFQVTPQELFVDRAEVGWCRGRLNAYSIHLDKRAPRADVVVYADRIDLGEALMMVMPFKGKVEGVLVGRFPLGIEGRQVRLSNGFLYSLPGQGGRLRLDDSEAMRALLERSGVKGDVQRPLSNALSDLDFSTIRMELEPDTDGDAVFRIKLAGKSNDRAWPAPVDLNLNVRGPLERLLNLGLDVSRK